MQPLGGNTEILSFERILWEMDSQEAASDAHICLEQKERDKCMKSELVLNFAVPVTCEKIASSLSLPGAQSGVKAEFNLCYCLKMYFLGTLSLN